MPIIYNPDYLMFKNCSDRIIVSERYSCGQSFSQWPSMVTIVIGRDQKYIKINDHFLSPSLEGWGVIYTNQYVHFSPPCLKDQSCF